ncbi:putative carbohydrate sulfotransferase 1-like [Penaeus vannamei]|uniref:Putative carbohydrate sulfotransferase 1-like n=1 Tax=Penaeus vannamei TaxID=6689 RepID=A0A423SZB6_PENVA|nr:putative carbohydrate sulfotransferase 1-like [Penaeus vannamei]
MRLKKLQKLKAPPPPLQRARRGRRRRPRKILVLEHRRPLRLLLPRGTHRAAPGLTLLLRADDVQLQGHDRRRESQGYLEPPQENLQLPVRPRLAGLCAEPESGAQEGGEALRTFARGICALLPQESVPQPDQHCRQGHTDAGFVAGRPPAGGGAGAEGRTPGEGPQSHLQVLQNDLQMIDTVKKLFPGRVTSVKYEDLCLDTKGVATTLWRFLSGAPEADLPPTWAHYLAEHTDGANRRGNAYSTWRDTRKEAEAWRQEIGESLLLAVEDHCGGAIDLLGHNKFHSLATARNLSNPLRWTRKPLYSLV